VAMVRRWMLDAGSSGAMKCSVYTELVCLMDAYAYGLSSSFKSLCDAT
jgi:hypothetical protein